MKKAKGFTLIELMIVVAIIGILSAIAIPKFADLIRKSNEGATKGNLGALRSAISIYYGEMEGVFPVPTHGATTMSAILTMDNGKYLKAIPSCYNPPAHSKVTTVTVDNNALSDANGWAYDDDRLNADTTRNWGDIWVSCSHNDSKSTQWSVY